MKRTGSKSVRVLAAVAAIVSLFALQTVPANAGGVDFRKAVPGSGKGLTIGLIGLDEMEMGIRIQPDHTVIDCENRLSPHLMAFGPFLRVTYCETIAVPELRAQARRVAETIL